MNYLCLTLHSAVSFCSTSIGFNEQRISAREEVEGHLPRALNARTWSSSPFLINKRLFIWNNYRIAPRKYTNRMTSWSSPKTFYDGDYKFNGIAASSKRVSEAEKKITNEKKQMGEHTAQPNKNESMHKIIKNERFVFWTDQSEVNTQRKVCVFIWMWGR